MLQPEQQHALQQYADGVGITQHTQQQQQQRDIVEHEELEKMRGVLVHEWLQFVNTEKKRRKELEVKLLALHGDVEATKQWALLQLQGLRDNMQAEFDVIIDVVNRCVLEGLCVDGLCVLMVGLCWYVCVYAEHPVVSSANVYLLYNRTSCTIE